MKKFFVGVKGVVRDRERGFILLRREYKSGDFWDMPGGRIDGSEEFADTLIRELNEELPGIKIDSVGSLVGAHRVQKDIEQDVSLVLLYFLVEATLPKEVVLSEEHDGYILVKSFNELPEGLNPTINNLLINELKK